jgi:hypothetical protein
VIFVASLEHAGFIATIETIVQQKNKQAGFHFTKQEYN